MSLLAKFEGVAELLFTGAFKKNPARLQPVEIAKELVKVMLKNKQISVSQVYVPNIYRVFIHPSDWGPLASFGESFLIELSKYVYAEGQRYGYTFLTKPAIELHSDETVEPHQLFVEVAFDDSILVEWDESSEDEEEEENKVDWREHTNIFHDDVGQKVPIDDETSRNPEYFLEIIEGPDVGQSFPIDSGDMYIGRHSQCEVVVHDLEVSRRHVKLTVKDQGWFLDDLGSTNGTLVNGQRITRDSVAPGDRIQLGQTVLVIQRAR